MAHLSSDRPQGPVAGEPIEDQFSASGLTGAVDLLWSLLDMTPSLGPTKLRARPVTPLFRNGSSGQVNQDQNGKVPGALPHYA
jgi:hypothetical protein